MDNFVKHLLLVIGYWLLVIGYLLFVIGYLLTVEFILLVCVGGLGLCSRDCNRPLIMPIHYPQ